MFSIIYISGYGRSGSTALEALLSQHADARSFGEIGNVRRPRRLNDVCTCGAARGACPYWGDPAFVDLMGRYNDMVRRPFSGPGTWRRVCADLAARTGASYMLDNSKNAQYRTLIPLMAWFHRDFHVLHISRDLRSVLASVGRGRNRYLATGTRDPRPRPVRIAVAGFGWLLANAAGRLAAAATDRVVRVRYEHLFADRTDAGVRDDSARIARLRGRAAWLDRFLDGRTPGRSGMHAISGNRWLLDGAPAGGGAEGGGGANDDGS